jgi:hypothetical protein
VIVLSGEADLTCAGQLSALITAQLSRGTRQPVARVLALTGAEQMFTIRGQTHGEPESESEAG